MIRSILLVVVLVILAATVARKVSDSWERAAKIAAAQNPE